MKKTRILTQLENGDDSFIALIEIEKDGMEKLKNLLEELESFTRKTRHLCSSNEHAIHLDSLAAVSTVEGSWLDENLTAGMIEGVNPEKWLENLLRNGYGGQTKIKEDAQIQTNELSASSIRAFIDCEGQSSGDDVYIKMRLMGYKDSESEVECESGDIYIDLNENATTKSQAA